MRITRSTDNPPEQLDATTFSGRPTRQDLGAYDAPEATVLLVNFPAGVRSHWHRHPGGQFLYFMKGSGRVGTRDGQLAEVSAGDLVHAPPGEEHWHGASEHEAAEHLAVSLGTTEWLDEVTP